MAGAKRRGLHPVGGEMFIAKEAREPPARFGGAELNLTSTNLVSFRPPNRAGGFLGTGL